MFIRNEVALSFDTAAGEPSGGAGTAAPAAPAAGEGQPSQGASQPAAAAPSTPPAAQPSSQPAPAGAPAFEPFELKVDGKVVKVESREELQRLAQQGYSFTQKSQQLAAERRAIQQREAAYRQEIERLKQVARGGNPENPEDPAATALAKVQQLEQKIADERLDSVLREVQGKYPDLDENVLLARAAKAGVSDQDLHRLTEIAEELNGEQSTSFDQRVAAIINEGKHPLLASFKQRVIDEYLAEKAKNGKPAGIVGTGGAPGGQPPAARPKTFEEADAQSKAQLGV